MDTITAIKSRRSVKQYDPHHQISEDEIAELVSLAVLSPTAFNLQHWRFVLIQNRALREEIQAVSSMQPQITDASLLIVVCADLNAWRKHPERYWQNAPQDVHEWIVGAINNHYEHHETRQRDEAMRSCGIAAQTLMLTAKAMGYDSSPMDLADMEAVGKLINLPQDHVIAMFVAIGKGVREPWPRSGQLPLSEVVVTDHF